jgi:hypothetical protein
LSKYYNTPERKAERNRKLAEKRRQDYDPNRLCPKCGKAFKVELKVGSCNRIFCTPKCRNAVNIKDEKYWTKEQDEVLEKNYYSKTKTKLLEMLPSRNWSGILHRAIRLNLSRDKKFQFEGMQNNNLTNNPMKDPFSRAKCSASNLRTGISLSSLSRNRLRFIQMLGNKCYYCGKVLLSNKMHIHHLDGDRKNNSISNQIILCHSCHQTYHNALNQMEYSIIESIEPLGLRETRDLSTPIWHNFILENGIVSHNSFKSGVNLELAGFMDRNFSADKIGFTDQEFLDKFKQYPQKAFIMRDEITSAGEYGIGSGRMQSFITINTETLRQNEVSIGTISPTEKPLGTAHYILHCIGHNKLMLDDEGMALEPVYVLVGVLNPPTHNYLGSMVIELDWMSKLWREYQLRKKDFLFKVQNMNFAKQDMEQLANKCLTDPLARFAKTKHDWLVIIQRVHPSLTTEEMEMVYAMVKMQSRMRAGITNGDFTEPEVKDGQADPD